MGSPISSPSATCNVRPNQDARRSSVVRALTRLCVAALAGAVIAWTVAGFVLYAMFAAGGYTREALVEPPPWAFGAIGGGGGVVALTLVWAVGRSPLPKWVRPAVIGGLTGV